MSPSGPIGRACWIEGAECRRSGCSDSTRKLTERGAWSDEEEEGVVGVVVLEVEGALVEGAEGVLVEGAEGVLVEGAEGVLVEGAEGALVEGA